MLGRLRMSVEDALHKYAELSKEVFSESKRFGDGKFKASKLEAAMKTVIAAQRAASDNVDARMRDDESCGPLCRTCVAARTSLGMQLTVDVHSRFVCATFPNALNAPTPTLFRTYEPRQGRFIDCMIWEAARATSAAPTFFKPIEIDNGHGVRSRYTDGCIGTNNPTDVVLREASEIFPDRKIACIISIGTGKPKNTMLARPSIFWRNMPRVDVALAIVDIAGDCEKIAEATEHRFSNTPNIYFRFNVDRGMEEINLGDWERLDVVDNVTEIYVKSTKVSKAMGDAAAALRARHGATPTIGAGTS